MAANVITLYIHNIWSGNNWQQQLRQAVSVSFYPYLTTLILLKGRLNKPSPFLYLIHDLIRLPILKAWPSDQQPSPSAPSVWYMISDNGPTPDQNHWYHLNWSCLEVPQEPSSRRMTPMMSWTPAWHDQGGCATIVGWDTITICGLHHDRRRRLGVHHGRSLHAWVVMLTRQNSAHWGVIVVGLRRIGGSERCNGTSWTWIKHLGFIVGVWNVSMYSFDWLKDAISS